MKVRIEIDTKTFVRFWLVVVGFFFAILLLYNARTALTIIGIAFFLAIALNGPVSRLAKHLPGKSRVLSTAIAFVLVISFLSAVIFLVIPPIAQQTLKFIDTVPEIVRNISTQSSGIGDLVTRYRIQPQVDQAVLALKDNSVDWATSAGRNFLNGIGSALSVFAATILVLVMTFLMLVEGPTWMERLWNSYKDSQKMKYHRKLVHKMSGVVSGYVTGQLTVSGLGGISAGLAVFIIHFFFPAVPANLALPTVAIAFTLSLIPMFGATIAGIIVSILLLVNSIPAGIVFAIFFMVYQQLENNFISPTIQAKRIELSPLAILVAVTTGLYMFGIAGGIISIPVAGCIKVLVEDYFDRTKRDREHNEQPMTKLINKLKGEES